MPSDLELHVSALIDEAGRIERESESAYLELGRIFPRVLAEMERGAGSSERSLQALQALEPGGAGRGAGSARYAFVEEASAFLNALRDRDTSFLARIIDGISRLADLEQIIARVRADSEEMEIISLNAMTVALKSGSQGKAFSVITDELKRLSGRTISLTEGVTASGRSLLEYFDRLRGILGELDGFQREFFAMIDRTLGSGFDEIVRDLRGATAFFSALMAEAKSVREPVLRVMNEVQLQDIVRQSLQHVGLSLEEALGSAGEDSPSESAFVAAVAELTGSLIEDIVGKLDASAAAFGADMDAVTLIVGESERKRQDYLAEGRSGGGHADSGSYQSGSRRYLALKRDVVALASRLTDQVAGLEGSFKGLASLLARFQNIVVASRIEVAKTKALSGVATTVGGMVSLTDRIEGDVNAAMESTKGFTKLANDALGGYSVEGDRESDRLVSTLRRVEEDIGILERSKDALHSAIADFSLYTEDFIALIGRSGEELGRIRGLAGRLRTIGLDLAGLKASLRESADPNAEGVESERMRRMVERFTIFTHKKAGGSIGRFAVEEGSAAGEVTLF